MPVDPFPTERQKMVETQLRRRGIHDASVLSAVAEVPRHLFVPTSLRDQAYEDHPLPIDCGQTISQPFIVAYMLQSLRLRASDIVLEIGTGSGYQTALLAQLAERVYSVERHLALAEEAGKLLKNMNFANAEVFVGDGSRGLPGHSPFDAIIVSAAAAELPSPLVDQLRAGGRMIAPVGSPESQYLVLLNKGVDGSVTLSTLDACRFVPLIAKD
jgi:protein-L-isoaspartate(D-aspartate) O-methyltransferase